jgi:hypothetical protein
MTPYQTRSDWTGEIFLDDGKLHPRSLVTFGDQSLLAKPVMGLVEEVMDSMAIEVSFESGIAPRSAII